MALDAASFALVVFQQRRQPPSGLQLSQPGIVLLAGIVISNTDGVNRWRHGPGPRRPGKFFCKL